jgi:uncharacterized membrane protein YphA (DoxX/SURF4 family)
MMNILIQFSRIFVGVLFIISGFIKANDTIGFSYKLEEYFEVFHMPVFIPWAVGLAMFICIFEIIVGVALLIGAYAYLNAWLLLLMIVFFTLLTGYSAITNKVTDCGCFGDAIKLEPVQSFYKDLILLAFIIIIFIGYRQIKPLFNKGIESIALFVCTLVVTAFTFYTYMFLPKIDFLPYKVGNNILKFMEIPADAPKDSVLMVFVYEKDGKQMEILMDEIAKVDDTYKFIERKDKLIKKGFTPAIHDFNIYDANGVEVTNDLLLDTSYKLVITQRDIHKSRKIESQMRALAEAWNKSVQTKIWGITSTSLDEVEVYRHENQLPYLYYTMDGTPIKSMVRSSPGIMLMKGSTVVKKWSSYNFPTFETVQKYMK